MADDKDAVIEKQQKKIRKLEAALKIVADYSGKTESRIRKQFEVVLETIPVPMIISKKNGKIVFANLAAHKTFGYAPEDFTGVETLSTYENPDDRNLFLDILSNKGEVNGFRLELRKSDGTIFPAVLFSQRFYFNVQDCILTVIHDLTDVMTLEKQLRQTQKMEAIGTLTGGIAHDFNNILSAIIGYTDLTLILLDPEENGKKKEYLNKSLKAANRAKNMIKQMMAFCRKSEIEKKPFQISLIVAEVVKLMGNLTPSDIVIRPDIKDQGMIIMGDPTQIHQLVTNLITNSVQALSGGGGKIEVILQKTDISQTMTGKTPIPKVKPGSYAIITVRDNGPGIVKHVIQNIFDPFFTTKPVGKGTGMGLAVVHGILQGHHGSVSVESEPGKGTAFHCYFPIIEYSDQTEKSDIEPASVGKGDEKILLVDDDAMVLGACGGLLESLGYRVTCCAGSRQGLNTFTTCPEDFDLVITDSIMPEMNGMEMSGEILKIRPDIPIIIAAGTMPEKESELKKLGIRKFIQKPFDRREIQSVIRKVMDSGKEV